MVDDVVASAGGLLLASRLRRLTERLQSDAARILESVGLALQPAQVPVLMALDGAGLTVGQIAEALQSSQPGVTRLVGQLAALGLIETQQGADLRQRRVVLTDAGRTALDMVTSTVRPGLEAAVDEMLGGDTQPLLGLIGRLERAMDESSMAARFERFQRPALTLHEYSDALAGDFAAINSEWITAMFKLEQTDRDVLDNPYEKIIEPGGTILFVEAEGLGIIGTCALQKTGPTGFELTKMGVLPSARGLKAGEFLLAAMIRTAQQLGADPLYLLTNAKCEAAIHLYEKLGFRHDVGIMAEYGARYARCDVAMRYQP